MFAPARRRRLAIFALVGTSIMSKSALGRAKPGAYSVYRTVSELKHPLSDMVLSFWAKRPEDGILLGRDIPSRPTARFLSRIIVHQPVENGADLKVRVAGDGIRHRFGMNITGMTMSAMFPTPDFAARRESVMKAIRDDKPQFADCLLAVGELEMLHTELVILPVVTANRLDRWAMTVCSFFN